MGNRRLACSIAALIVSLSGFAERTARAATEPGAAVPGDIAAETIRVPGGAAAFAFAAGVPPDTPRTHLLVEFIRRAYDVAPPGKESRRPALDAILQHLAKQHPGVPATGEDLLPLPLGERVWLGLIEKSTPETLLHAILADRRTTLLYYGLLAVDPETRTALAARPRILRRICDGHSGRFAAFGRSLRIRGRALLLPGGPEARPLWRDVFGDKVDAADDRGIVEVFDRDEGRFAYFVDALTHLDPPQLSFALGTSLALEDREERFEALYRVFTDVASPWNVEHQPFWRPQIDPWLVLSRSRVLPGGTAAPPARAELWRAVFERDTGRLQLRDADEPLIDAAVLTSAICLGPVVERDERFRTFQFAQRVFVGATAPQADDVAAILLALGRMPALLLTLERIGITDPALYRAVIAAAAALDGLSDEDREVARSMFQAALFFVERARVNRSLDGAQAAALVRTLADTTLAGDVSYGDAVAQWLDRLAPGIDDAAADVGADDVEKRLIAALSGVGTHRRPGGRVVWEGVEYRLDVAVGELVRMQRVRERQGGLRLDDAVGLMAAARDLASTNGRDRAAARTIALLEQIAAAMASGGRDDRVRRIESIREDLQPLAQRDDADRRARLARDVFRVAESALADVLRTIVYAVAIVHPDSQALLGSNVALRHDFGDESEAWRAPSEQRTRARGWHVRGSLLLLDVALARLGLRRVGSGTISGGTLNEIDRAGFAETAALLNPFDLVDDDRRRIAEAVRQGRERLAALPSANGDATVDDLATRAGLSAVRREGLRWTAMHDREHLDGSLTAGELLMIGWTDEPAALHRWGVSQRVLDGCTCVEFPGRMPRELFAGRRRSGIAATRIADLNVAVALWLEELQLPAALARDVLRGATQDLIDEVAPTDPDDYWTVARAAGMIDRTRIADYVSLAAAVGSLVPAAEALP